MGRAKKSTAKDIVKGVLKGNPRAIAKAITAVENDGRRAQQMMRKIFPHTGSSVIIGITGSPGSGKSTLVDQLVGNFRKNEKKIGIVAVDPTSPFSGGAILGDRIRMMRHSLDPEVFIRSMATRGHLGGIAKATGEAIAIFEAAGKDIVLVETVGVGQDEVEVVKLADIILVILMPGTGDDIQIFKAGIMEIADIFVLNKADSPGADKMEKQLRAMLDMGMKGKQVPPVLKTVATEGKGIDVLAGEVTRFITTRGPRFQEIRRKRLISWMLTDIIKDKLWMKIDHKVKKEEFERIVEEIFRREKDPYSVADELVRRIGREG